MYDKVDITTLLEKYKPFHKWCRDNWGFETYKIGFEPQNIPYCKHQMNQDVSGKKWNYKSTRRNLNRKCLSNCDSKYRRHKQKQIWLHKIKDFQRGKKNHHKWIQTYTTDWEKIFATPTEDNI